MGDGAVTEKDGECDPISVYLKNRVVIPLHLQHTYAHFPIRHNRRRAEMESRAQSECQWTEEVSAMDSMSLLLTSSVKAGVSHTKWKRKVNA